MATTIEERMTELEKKVEELQKSLLTKEKDSKNWRRTVGKLVDDEMSRAADRAGAEWRRTAE